MSTGGIVLDAGVFIALERRDERAVSLVHQWQERGIRLVTSAAVVAQVWRGGRDKQAPVAFLRNRTDVMRIDQPVARALGLICGLTDTSDVVDAHVALLARERRWPVVTSDPNDLRRLDPTLRIGVI